MSWISAIEALTSFDGAELSGFGAALEVSVAINFAYSVLINFGRLSGQTIGRWVDREKLRVIPAMSETKTFNLAGFVTGLDQIESKALSAFKWVNRPIIAWAILAGATSIAILVVIGIKPKIIVTPVIVWASVALLFGAVPIGLFGCGIIHIVTWVKMLILSYKCNAFLHLIQAAPAEKVAEAREALRKRLQDARRENND